jgi:hypothetical protein
MATIKTGEGIQVLLLKGNMEPASPNFSLEPGKEWRLCACDRTLSFPGKSVRHCFPINRLSKSKVLHNYDLENMDFQQDVLNVNLKKAVF